MQVAAVDWDLVVLLQCDASLSVLPSLVVAGRGEDPPIEEAMQMLRSWRDVSKEDLLLAFEGGNFAGIEEMKRNDRLFERVAPMAVNDIMMAVQYR